MKVDVRLISEMKDYKMNYNPRVNCVSTRLINATYMMSLGYENLNMSEVPRQHLVDNIDRNNKSKGVVFRFESLLTHLIFQVL